MLAERVCDVFENRQRIEEGRALKNHPHFLAHFEGLGEAEARYLVTVDEDLALVGNQKSQEKLQDRRLSGS